MEIGYWLEWWAFLQVIGTLVGLALLPVMLWFQWKYVWRHIFRRRP